MDRVEFIGKLRMCYFGEKNAFEEIIEEYDRLIVLVDDLKDKIEELKRNNEAIPPEVIGTNGEDGGLFDYGDR